MNYVGLAKAAIEEYVRNGKIISIPENLPPEFHKKGRGVFVSLHKRKELRGCVGTYLPAHENLAEEIILNAVAACSRDYRFNSITADELPILSVEVSLLSPPERIKNVGELDPNKYGVVVKCSDGRTGLLLPDLEGVDSAQEQIAIACQKAGINPVSDKEIEIHKFTVEKYE